MKELYQFLNNKNKISYTLNKAYDLGFASAGDNNETKCLHRIDKMKASVTNSYMADKILYTDVNIDFMDIIPYSNNIDQLNEVISNITTQYLVDGCVVDDMLGDYLIEQMDNQKIIFINLCINRYNNDRCEEEDSIHGTSMIFIPHKDKYNVYYINSHGNDMKTSTEFHIIKTKTRSKVLKLGTPIDFIFLESFVKYMNTKYDNRLVYNISHNYFGANLQSGDNHGICFVFPYLIFYNLCKYYTQKKELFEGSYIDNFETLLVNGNIKTLVHSCLIDFIDTLDTIEKIDDTNTIDDIIVKLDYRFIKKVSNAFVAYVSQSCFLR